MPDLFTDGIPYSVTHQTPGAGATGQTSFATTTPTFILYGSSLTKGVKLSSIELNQTGTVAGGAITVVVGVDTVVRYASGGTAVVPQIRHNSVTTASAYAFSFNATASDVASRYVYQRTIPAALNTSLIIDFGDEARIYGTGAILVWTYASTTGPTWLFNFDYLER